jgi:hypothetical protein
VLRIIDSRFGQLLASLLFPCIQTLLYVKTMTREVAVISSGPSMAASVAGMLLCLTLATLCVCFGAISAMLHCIDALTVQVQ